VSSASKDHRAKEIIDLGSKLYNLKQNLDGLHQEIAWQFCPDLAEFTTKLELGEDWGGERMDSFPEQVSRELSNSLSAMLRPKDRPWFRTTTLDDRVDADEANARYLEYVTSVMRRSIYDPRTKFVRATKEGDRFYVNFGQAVISVEESADRTHLYYRNHHIKDCVWLENDVGEVDHLHRKEMMTARAMRMKFAGRGDKLDNKIIDACEKEPHKEFEVRVVVMPRWEFERTSDWNVQPEEDSPRAKRLPYVILYIDVEHVNIIRMGRMAEFPYVVPRWHRWANTQYAFSPATMPSLADARMAQMLSQILLESGEKAIDPPLIGKADVIIGEPNLRAGGLSWVDIDHDAKLSEALEAVQINADMKVAFEMRKDLREMLAKGFYLDKLVLPEAGNRMTAFEVSRRLEEHVRNLLPLFEPMEIEYNTRLLDKTYAFLSNMRVFDLEAMPESLSNADISWAFESPIQQAQQVLMVEQFKGSLEMMALGMQAGASANPLKIDVALQDAIRGIGGPATWRKTKEEQEQEAKEMALKQKLMEVAQALGGAGQVAGMAGEGIRKLQDTGLVPNPARDQKGNPLPPQEDQLALPPPETLPIDPAADADALAQAAGIA
jgi:hypothetical protein